MAFTRQTEKLFPMGGMVINDKHYDPVYVSQTLKSYLSLPLPRGGRSIGQHTSIHLYEQDGYLSGMIDTYLTGAEWRFASINLKSSVDEGLMNYTPTSDEDVEMIEDFRTFRSKMIEVAGVLSAITNTPIRWL